MDAIHIHDLEVFAAHGVYPEENRLGQKFLVSADLFLDLSGAGCTDELEKTVDYGEVCHRIADVMQNNCFRLLETAAEKLSREILLHYPLINRVRIRIDKPWAPVGMSLDTCGVSIERGWHRVCIALGSNLGDPSEHLRKAVEELKENPDIVVEKYADPIVTKPYGGVEQPDFLNSALTARTILTPVQLLEELHRIEALHQRERIIHWGPRTLDLDLIFYDDLIMDTEQLTIPHREMHLRDFVLQPLAQIVPYYRHPVMNKTVKQLLDERNER